MDPVDRPAAASRRTSRGAARAPSPSPSSSGTTRRPAIDPSPAVAAVLGGMPVAEFLRDYWQKQPLLIRQALPGFAGILERDQLLALAKREDVTSRLIIEHPRRRKARWERYDGPFDALGALGAGDLPASHWTLLVHGLESLVPGGWELLREFSFIPTARIDDLMVSFAVDGGSVGPHDDQYDVFLLQGPGRRRWQVSTCGDGALDPDAAIKVLQSFVPEQEWILEPGDMLYVPPGVAHLGVALGPCFTYSIGFLAPSHRDLVQGFLGYLGEVLEAGIDPDALYEDPDLRAQAEPLEIGDVMLDKVAAILGQIRWQGAAVSDFLGRFLTGQKPESAFPAPARPLSAGAFARRLSGRGRLELALASRGLVRGDRIFLNGQAHTASPSMLALFKRLVHERALPLPLSGEAGAQALSLLHDWYAAGYLRLR